MAKACTFTTKHYPVNDLWAFDLENHLEEMAKAGWQLVSTQHLVNEHSPDTPQLLLFWGKEE